MSGRLRWLRPALPSILSIATSLAVCFLAIAVTLSSLTLAGQAYLGMAWGAFGDWPRFFESGNWAARLRPWGAAGTKAALLTFTGLSVAVAFRVGLFNIGAQGQMIAGAIAAAVVGAQVELW